MLMDSGKDLLYRYTLRMGEASVSVVCIMILKNRVRGLKARILFLFVIKGEVHLRSVTDHIIFYVLPAASRPAIHSHPALL
jgi:hypothetical protein